MVQSKSAPQHRCIVVSHPAPRYPSVLDQGGNQYGLNRIANPSAATPKVITLPKPLDEKVARLHLSKYGVNLTTLSEEQADYIGVPVQGPYKPNHYRY